MKKRRCQFQNVRLCGGPCKLNYFGSKVESKLRALNRSSKARQRGQAPPIRGGGVNFIFNMFYMKKFTLIFMQNNFVGV